MPRVSKAQTAANHQAIEAAASRLFRERGLDAVTVAEVMAEAGLTHGGFYTHYESKDALAASACEAAFAFAAEKWRRRIEAAPSPAAAKDVIAERYLRSANCDPTVASCPTATLVTDVARAEAEHPIRAAYLAGVRDQIDTLAKLGRSGDRARDRADACVQLATMMGALLIARATHGDPISEEIVTAARSHLTRRRSNRKVVRK
ncbi:MAG TPA: helix-turn-helix domain-containing protein [Vicinamibacterales bacterium]|nr:helix-turn-helix domain-containing protein [Vicinamibacterales bacterium]